MPTGESAGAIYVTIDADGSPLLAKYAQAEAQSRAAGTRIAAGLGQGLQAASGIVDQFGRAVSSGISAPMEAAAPAVEKTAVAIRTVGAAAESSVPQISAMSGAIRVLSGEQSIRAIERFGVSMGLGGAAVAAFPLIGLLAIGELASRVAGQLDKLSEAAKAFAEESKRATEEAKRQSEAFDQLEVSRAKIEIGGIGAQGVANFFAASKAAENQAALTEQTAHLKEMTDRLTAAKAEAAALGTVAGAAFSYTNKIDAQSDAIKAQKLVVNGLADSVREYNLAQKPLLDAQLAQQKAANAGSLQSAQLSNKGAALTGEIARAAAIRSIQEGQIHASTQADIDAMADRQAAAVASAAEEVRVAKQKESDITADQAAELPRRIALIQAEGQAKKLGKDPDEFATIDAETVGKVAAARRTSDQDILDSHAQTIAAENRLDEARAAASREVADGIAKYWLKTEEGLEHDTDELARIMQEKIRQADEARKRAANLTLRTGQTGVKASGVESEGANETAKLQTQLSYEQQITHSRAQQIQYAQQMAGYEVEAANIKVQIARDELTAAIAADLQLSDEQTQNKIATDHLALEEAITAQKKAQLEAQLKITKAEQDANILIQLQVQLTQQAEGVAKSLGDAISEGILGKHKKNKSIGASILEDIAASMKSTGQHILGDVFTAAIKEALEASGVNAAAHKLGGVIFGTPAGTNAAGQPTAATGGLLGAVLGKLAGALHIPMSKVPTAPGNPNGPHPATAPASPGSRNPATATAQDQQERTLQQILQAIQQEQSCCASSKPQIAAIAANAPRQTALLGAVAAGVNFMAALELISILTPKPFGFARGGRPAPGVPYIVGENGPELRIDDGPGVIIPGVPSMAQLGGLQNSSSFSSSSHSQALSIGSLHVHGMQSAEQFARALPRVLKTRAPSFSPATR